jgi:carbamate kinase
VIPAAARQQGSRGLPQRRPAIRDEHGQLQEVEASVENDPTSAVLAAALDAGLPISPTGVARVMRDNGSPGQSPICSGTPTVGGPASAPRIHGVQGRGCVRYAEVTVSLDNAIDPRAYDAYAVVDAAGG